MAVAWTLAFVLEPVQQVSAALAEMVRSGVIWHAAWATLLGIVVGMLPGLTATLGLTLLIGLTIYMDPNAGILALLCMYIGAIYGGSRSAILLNIPGTPANAATSLDGYPLARMGKVGPAMGIATTGSVLGSIVGILALAMFAPQLARFALDFGSYEFFWIAMFGVVISGMVTASHEPVKGWLAGFLGLLIAMVGLDAMHSYPRFAYGSAELAGGFGLLPVLIGVFGMAEILTVMKEGSRGTIQASAGSVVPRLGQIIRYRWAILRSGLLGTGTGLIPGVGEDMGSWTSYAVSRNLSKDREQYGKGSEEGLLSAETGNSASVAGAMIPVLTLAIPGSAPAAVLLAAMQIHHMQPGPQIADATLYNIVAMLLVGAVMMGVFGLLLTRPLLWVLRVPRPMLLPVIAVLCVLGAYAVNERVFDIWVMLAFGVVGFVLRQLQFPMAPLVLGVVLGPILDQNLRRGLMLTGGDPAPFFTRPISAVLCLATVLAILLASARLRGWLMTGLTRLHRQRRGA